MTDPESEEINHREKNDQVVYIMVPRKFIITLITIAAVCLIAAGVAMQWASYVDDRSNQRWCGIVDLFNETYRESPPPTEIGKKLAVEFIQLDKSFHCS